MGKLNEPARTCGFAFYQLYPNQKLPVLAKDYCSAMPLRAQRHCPPFRSPLREGCYFYSPIAFEFKVERNAMYVRTRRSDGTYATAVSHRVSDHVRLSATIDTSDLGADVHQEFLRRHKELVKHDDFAANLATTALLNFVAEEDPFGFIIQVWLGGIVELDPGDKLFIKAPVNLFADPGYDVLDGIIESDRWHGWLAVILRPRRFGEWVSVGVAEPLVQGLVYQFKDVELRTTPVDAVPPKVYTNLLRWHSRENGYQDPPGKYQRQLQKDATWTCGDSVES